MQDSSPGILPAPNSTAAEQYRAAVERCVLVDLADREQIELTGADRAAFLHNFCTQEIKKLPVGHGAEAFLANIKGRILGHVLVFVGRQAIWLDGPAGSAAALIPHLDRYLITEDVQLADRSGDWGEVALIGPQAATLVETLLPGSGAFETCQHGHADGVTVRRFSFTRQPGWLIGAMRDRLPAVAEQLAAGGATVCSAEVFDALRIEAGFPVYGVDITEDNLAQEAGRTRQAISFTKGCYLGQEPIARIDALGHTNRELRGLRLSDATIPAAGAAVVAPETGAELGTITSAALSPVDGCGVALAMLRREACALGTPAAVAIGGDHYAATVFWP